MHQCCTHPYDREFDITHAQNDLEEYKSRGPKKNTQPLLKVLDNIDLKGKSLLDIGGGIGTVIFELFERGIESATHVDISSAYVDAFNAEAGRRSLSDCVTSLQGDFVEVYKKIDRADIVTLDKVICCYEQYANLVRRSVQKAAMCYAIVVPRDLWWVRSAQYLEGLWRRFRGKYFKTYVHPISHIERIISEEGLQLYAHTFQREWYYALYVR